MNFERGQDIKETLGIGMDAMLKEIGGIIVRRGDFVRFPGKLTVVRLKSEVHDQYYTCGVMILIHKGNYKILKNKYGDNWFGEGNESDLPKVVKEIYEKAKDWLIFDDIWLPVTKISPGLASAKLVSVQPLQKPSGSLMYLDYKYGKNGFQRIMDKIKKWISKETKIH